MINIPSITPTEFEKMKHGHNTILLVYASKWQEKSEVDQWNGVILRLKRYFREEVAFLKYDATLDMSLADKIKATCSPSFAIYRDGILQGVAEAIKKDNSDPQMSINVGTKDILKRITNISPID